VMKASFVDPSSAVTYMWELKGTGSLTLMGGLGLDLITWGQSSDNMGTEWKGVSCLWDQGDHLK
jgi:hypothetical protein